MTSESNKVDQVDDAISEVLEEDAFEAVIVTPKTQSILNRFLIIFTAFLVGCVLVGFFAYGWVRYSTSLEVEQNSEKEIDQRVSSLKKELSEQKNASKKLQESVELLSSKVGLLQGEIEAGKVFAKEALEENKLVFEELFKGINKKLNLIGISQDSVIVLPDQENELAAKILAVKELEGRMNIVIGEANKKILLAEKKEQEMMVIEASEFIRNKIQSIRNFVDLGQPFDNLINELSDKILVPSDLKLMAAKGVMPLRDVQKEFLELSRKALSKSFETVSDRSMKDKVTIFVRKSLGARSLTPRIGDDPDAILSRAEAFVIEKKLSDALELISFLPPEGLTEFEGWTKSVDDLIYVYKMLDELEISIIAGRE
ncbi:MAG: hypothetical protein O3A15_00765 [Proteobacteria bacterium]|nr:hypothetical protein [Pseudomonadota bacterium]